MQIKAFEELKVGSMIFNIDTFDNSVVGCGVVTWIRREVGWNRMRARINWVWRYDNSPYSEYSGGVINDFLHFGDWRAYAV